MLTEQLLSDDFPAPTGFLRCRLCLGSVPKPIQPCRCSSQAIHENCLKVIISQSLKYKQ